MTERTKPVIVVNVINYYLNQQAAGSGPPTTALVMG